MWFMEAFSPDTGVAPLARLATTAHGGARAAAMRRTLDPLFHPVVLVLLLAAFILSASPLPAHANDEAAVLYAERCSVCHGEKGDGAAIANHSMRVKPTDFSLGVYKYRTTPWGKPPTDKDIERSIRFGLWGTSMPAWDDLLSDQQISGLVKYVKGLSRKRLPPADPIAVPALVNVKGDIENGKRLYVSAGCVQCHGARLDGHEQRVERIRNGISSGVPPRDLTDHRNYRWGASLEEIYTRITTGLNGTEMRGYGGVLSRKQITDLAAYLKHAYEQREKSRWLTPTSHTVEERGDYLLATGVCELCHTTMQPDAAFNEQLVYAGGMRVVSPADGTFYSRNITSDRESGVGAWSTTEIVRAIRRGESRNGGALYAFSMPWIFYYTMKETDAEALAHALKRLPPVYNKIPPTAPSDFWTAFITKARVAFGLEDRVLEFSQGSRGLTDRAAGKAIPALSEQTHWSLVPPMGLVSADRVVSASGFDLPVPRPTGSLIEDAKLMHGRYLVSISPCALCHTPTAGKIVLEAAPHLSGGIRVSLRHFGTVYTGNLTSDPETGLGAWKDHEIRRALRSGIRKNGQRMHFQAMPWPIFSNMTEADTEAVVAYLRTLPPVNKRLPPRETTALKDYTISDHDFGVIE